MKRNTGSWDTPQGSLHYLLDEEGKGIVITGYSGRDTQLQIPGQIEGLPVTGIRKKTFLSRKQLRRVILPPTIEEIGDWTFAYCTNLESVWLARKPYRLGSQIFMECPGIHQLVVYEAEGRNLPTEEMDEIEKQTAALLAASTVLLDAEYLMNPLEAGTSFWLQQWDARMQQVMQAEDSEGYTKMILCGEEDVGSSLELYLNHKRKCKVRLALLRLMNPVGLSKENSEELEEYLRSRTRGCETEETWEVVLKEHGHEQEYFEVFTKVGCVTEENFDALLTDMGSQYTEMKAFLMRYKEENMTGKDFFETLSLGNW